ncbi:unnamed protein product [Pieris brassicae]|uniref:Uncharacterized protein n=1 Tax=Pieris brassicae TaxID=7116 RepID=A0A9P0XEF3_PIEBR|nr:unnamed protein product [Pieris brassicae]
MKVKSKSTEGAKDVDPAESGPIQNLRLPSSDIRDPGLVRTGLRHTKEAPARDPKQDLMADRRRPVVRTTPPLLGTST